jgi:hypothetical protein
MSFSVIVAIAHNRCILRVVGPRDFPVSRHFTGGFRLAQYFGIIEGKHNNEEERDVGRGYYAS